MFVAVAEVALAEAIAPLFDVLVIDLEHGPLDAAQAQPLLIAIQSRGAAAYVRVAGAGDQRLPAVLDGGADGVVAPMVASAADAAEFASRAHYPPAGRRGYGPRRAGDFGRRSPLSEPEPTCAVQIETEAGVEAAQEIAATEGVDLLILGCADLALSLGTPGEFETAPMREAISAVTGAAQDAGISFALAAGGPVERLPQLLSGPVDLVLHGVDLRLYVGAADASAKALRQVVERLGVGEGNPPARPRDP